MTLTKCDCGILESCKDFSVMSERRVEKRDDAIVKELGMKHREEIRDDVDGDELPRVCYKFHEYETKNQL